MMWHTRSVTVLAVMYRSYLVMGLQTRESDAAVRVALLSACEMPVRAPRTQQSPVVLVVIQAPEVVSDSLCAEEEEAAAW